MNEKARGFTIVELLIVIVVIQQEQLPMLHRLFCRSFQSKPLLLPLPTKLCGNFLIAHQSLLSDLHNVHYNPVKHKPSWEGKTDIANEKRHKI